MNAQPLFAIHASYLIAAAMFVVGLRRLARVRTARSGNLLAAIGMLIAVIATLAATTNIGWIWIVSGLGAGSIVGAALARWVQMTKMPELVAFFNGLGGAASSAVALAYFFSLEIKRGATLSSVIDGYIILVLFLSVVVGMLTLTGSLVAFGKLAGKLPGRAVLLPARHVITLVLLGGTLAAAIVGAYVASTPTTTVVWMLVVVGAAALLGVLLVIPIGGADMPVVISLLNSYSGIAASMAGFVLLVRNEPSAYMLVISGALVGASGLILTNIMCKAMNRSLLNVLVGGFGETADAGAAGDASEYQNVKRFSAEEAAMLLDGIDLAIIVPGYGLAVAQAQHAIAELDEMLSERGVDVRYAIHPVAGRMPGHMNVLLAEANVPYEKFFDLDQINGEFKNADVAIVVGANDVANPAALDDPASPIYGMPILNCHEARNVIVIKRSLSPGYAGIKNKLFEHDNTMMLFADAKQALLDINAEIKAL
ncbi:MAG: NAD(P)(+) transhydrogenase (Re/Si-specific) subunit beta [Myxococcales bacterium]|nr:NAD(P)(+) transhydrogenase (Re/Si-specific) subunit beta [Myxococcales bacterium]